MANNDPDGIISLSIYSQSIEIKDIKNSIDNLYLRIQRLERFITALLKMNGWEDQ